MNVFQLQSTGGRKAIQYSIVPSYGYSVGVDITGNHLTIVLLNMKGKMIDQNRIRFSFQDDLNSYQTIADKINDTISNNQIESSKIIGVGISIAGIVDMKNNLLYISHVLNLKELDLSKFSQFISFPLYFFNDANSAAYAEKNIQMISDFLYIALNYSIGGAIYKDNQMQYGDNFKAGEFGHMMIVPKGKTCYCGKQGCFDAYCSERVLLEYANDLDTFFDLLKKDESHASEIWKTYLNHLAIAIHNLRMIFDCDIVLGGNISNFLEPYMLDLSQKINKYNPFEQLTSYLKLGQCKKEASAMGAAMVHLDHFFEGTL